MVSHFVMKFFQDGELTLKKARSKDTLEQFIKKTLILSVMFAFILNIPLFFIFIAEEIIYVSVISFFFFFIIFFYFFKSMPNFAVKKKKNDLESDLLYSGRYLLLKLESGQPLIGALVEVSAIDTKSSKFFAEIVNDVYLGTPIEDAIDRAVRISPSKPFKKLLEQLKSALETGADVKDSLKATMQEVINERTIEIQSYGKKLGPLTMFYMIIGTIMPSLGAAMIVIASSFVNLKISLGVLLGLAGLLFIMQYFFLMFFKSIRPAVSL